MNAEDWARAIKTGTNITALPEFAEALQLTKWFFDNAVTPNWSGIKGLSGIGLDIPDFVAGKTAMAFGADFAYPSMAAAKFKFASMPFPTITSATTPLSQNLPAQFGATPGGTSYLIPATTKGDNLTYAVKFLQYMTSPKTAQRWITESTGAPSVSGEVGVPGIAAFNVGDWANQMRNGYGLWDDGNPFWPAGGQYRASDHDGVPARLDEPQGHPGGARGGARAGRQLRHRPEPEHLGQGVLGQVAWGTGAGYLPATPEGPGTAARGLAAHAG